MRQGKNKERLLYEWTKGHLDNIGVTSTYPYDPIVFHLRGRNMHDVINLFFDNNTKEIHILDQTILEQFWWIKPDLISARYCKIQHPNYYSGEYIFDRDNGERTILEVRQPDIDGKHWRGDHIHIKRGLKDLDSEYKITKPTFNEHIALTGVVVNAVLIMRIHESWAGAK
jgi:hypothetical protein